MALAPMWTSSACQNSIAPVAQIDDLVNYDAIIFGTPTRFGNMAAQMKNFIDQAGDLCAQDKLIGKVGSVFTATASQHGGQEATILSFHTVLLHLGFIVVGLPYSFKGQMGIKDVHGITPYGATTVVVTTLGMRLDAHQCRVTRRR